MSIDTYFSDLLTLSPDDIAGLAAEVSGPVLLPGAEGYVAECTTFNLNGAPEPAVVVGATSAADVQAAVRFAHTRGMPVGVRGGGHQQVLPGRDGLVINTSRMDGVVIDAKSRTARVEAGVQWFQVVQAAAEHGLAALNGSSMTVGVVGYHTGGGHGPLLGRSLGYAADYVRVIDVVTADGELRRVTAEQEPDLFWAVRGGKGNFGVVTAIEFDLFPVTRFYGGGLWFPIERTADVLRAWREWVVTLPEEASSSVAIKRLPELPELPPQLSGAALVHLRYAHLGPADEGARVFAPIRALGGVLIDGVVESSYADVGLIHMDPPDSVAYFDATSALAALPEQAVDRLVDLVGPDSDSPLVHVEIRHLGGALDREPAVPNAVSTRGVPFVLFGFGAGGPDEADLLQEHLDALVSGLAPWADGRQMINFLSPYEATTVERLREAYGAERYDRLAAIKKRYDPDNVFRLNHNILPA